VRVVEEREKPNADRLPEYTEARLATFERQLYSPSPIYPDAEKAKLTDSLAFMQEKLGAATRSSRRSSPARRQRRGPPSLSRQHAH